MVGTMRIVRRTAVLIAFALGSWLLAAPAGADPGMPPCEGPMAFICSMVPTMPELDHDLDLTQQQPGATVNNEELPPADVCALSCV